jgi:hypothetical protein
VTPLEPPTCSASIRARAPAGPTWGERTRNECDVTRPPSRLHTRQPPVRTRCLPPPTSTSLSVPAFEARDLASVMSYTGRCVCTRVVAHDAMIYWMWQNTAPGPILYLPLELRPDTVAGPATSAQCNSSPCRRPQLSSALIAIRDTYDVGSLSPQTTSPRQTRHEVSSCS